MTANIVSIITAVHAPSAAYLPDTYASLQSQILPAGWDWEWLVQEDGLAGVAEPYLPDDPRISAGTGKPGGPANTRNMALSRATGRLVRVLDSDDQLTPGALAREIEILTNRADVGWTTSAVCDLLPDGTTATWEHANPQAGPLHRGSVLSYFQTHNRRLPVHPATLCIRAPLILALGGWMALPAGEDTGLLLAASAVSTGYFLADAGLLYRKWPGQITAQDDWNEPVEWDARTRLMESRARVLADLWEARALW